MTGKSLSRLFILLCFLSACSDPPSKHTTPPTKNLPQVEATADTVSVELAPFDRFPADEKFPLVFRFGKAVAPAERNATQNFEKLSLTPARPGKWRWSSDSELHFTPLDPWHPEEKVQISLTGLTASSGAHQSGPAPSPQIFDVTLPKAEAALAFCELRVDNLAPLIQVPHIGLRFNYGVRVFPKDFWQLNLTRKQEQEQLSIQSSGWYKRSLRIDVQGPKIFRPRSAGKIQFELRKGLPVGTSSTLSKGLNCTIPISPERWDDLAEQLELEGNKPKLAELRLTPPQRNIGDPEGGRQPLQISFVTPWTNTEISHGKAKGITLDQGVSLSPSVEGEWKTSDANEADLVFTPSDPWPIGIETTVVVDPNIFPSVELRTSEQTFTTPSMIGRFEKAELYTDPRDPLRRKIVATLEFSHPPNKSDLERLSRISLRIEPEKKFQRKLSFTVSPDEKSQFKMHIQSEEIPLPDEPGEVRVFVESGLASEAGGTPTRYSYSRLVSVPSRHDVFQIQTAALSIVRKPDEELQRVLTVEASEPISAEKLASGLHLFLLPDCQEKKNRKICRKRDSFGHQSAVHPEVLEVATQLELAPLPADERTSPNMFHFSFEAPGRREVLLLVDNGLKANTGFSLRKDFRSVLFVDEFSRQLKIMHEGSLLSLSGSKKLGVSLRNITNVRFDLARILPHDVHHLVSVNQGSFSSPKFGYNNFALNQFAEHLSYLASFPGRDPGKTTYTAVDFSRFLKSGQTPQGLFVLTSREIIEGEDEDKQSARAKAYQRCMSYSYRRNCDSSAPLQDQRLVLLTDLGILVKDSLSGEHDVFVMSFRTGNPVKNAEVKLVGQNGLPLYTKRTDGTGRVTFPKTDDLKREQVPLLYVAQKGKDYSFLPFRRGDRQINISRFNTSGVVNRAEAEGLRAMIFSDRGIYRPGEEARFGLIVRRRNLELAGGELPLELSLTDPRGVEIQRRKFILSEFGFNDYQWNTEGALTGTYSLAIYLVQDRDKKKRALLGINSFRVDEFQPDRLAVTARYVALDKGKYSGWSERRGKFEVDVQNLFGTAAVRNTVAGTLLARPWKGDLSAYPGFRFYSPHEEREFPNQSESLGEVKTDENGKAEFTPDLNRFSERAFRLEFAAEAFEKDSGRSVVSTTSALVSDADLFVGWKADGSLSYISKGAGRKISLVAVGHDLKSQKVSNLSLELEETRMISALVKQPNGTLQYELSPKKSIVSKEAFEIAENGTDLLLKTATPGDFILRVVDSAGLVLNSLRYVVHGEGNTTFATDRTTEVGLQLKRTSVLPGEDLEISINTPYSGTGLITIERDRVYAVKWFKADGLSSVQTIRVPEDVIGNAYVSVVFVRSADSKDIYASPLSYGVKPFTISSSKYTVGIELDAPEKITPGTALSVKYRLDSQAKLLIYAVDEGILQFARYKNPDPVRTFVPKRALEVNTFQILDLLLPDYRIVSELSSPGGDEDVGLGKFKNPFARKRRAPMAFWSGVIDGDALEGTVEIPVPEYFNGTIRLLAVAVGRAKLGFESLRSVAQQDFVIEPQVPYFVSPGDEFEIGATVANTIVGSGENVELTVVVTPPAGFEAIDSGPVKLIVPEGQDKSFRIRMRAGNSPGEQEIRFVATGLGKTTGTTETMSIRPPQPFRTALQTGIYRPDKDGAEAQKSLSPQRVLYPQLRDVTASISESPLTVGRALMGYLKEYPYGCTEQLVSVAFPAVLFGTDDDIGLSSNDVKRFTSRAFQALSGRQLADGSFAMWDGMYDADPLFSVYATHFLVEAKTRQLEVPEVVLDRAMKWVKEFGADPKYKLPLQFAQSYALYLRSHTGEVVSKEVQALIQDLDRQWGKEWRDSAIALFLAGAFKAMQMEEQANELLKLPPEIWKENLPWPLNDAALYGSIYSWVSSRHFPEDKWLSPLDTVIPLERMIQARSVYSFNAAFAILGLRAASERLAVTQSEVLKITTEPQANGSSPLELHGHTILTAAVPDGAERLSYSGESGKVFFYSLQETGFDSVTPDPIESGISLHRELRNQDGELKKSFSLNEKVEVTLFIKAEKPAKRVAVLELLPGGFEIDLSDEGLANRQSLHKGPNTWEPTSIDVQEDRIIFFGDLPKDTRTFTYRLKPLSRGSYTLAPLYAEGMYDPALQFLGAPEKVEVK